jgi:hypothetical protein
LATSTPETSPRDAWVRAPSNRKVSCPQCGGPKERRAATCLECFASRPLDERFWAKVDRGDEDQCWEWQAGRTNGYGIFWIGDRLVRAHRFAYELLVGPIPDGLELDHLCRNRACVNPGHLEPVTREENLRRGIHVNREKTHCPQNHPYDEVNTYIEGGRRHCRICVREAGRRYRERSQIAA